MDNHSHHTVSSHDSHHGHASHGSKTGASPHASHGTSHHGDMVADFRRRFWICLVLTLPVLLFSPLIQKLLGLQAIISFPGQRYLLFLLSSAIFFYGGYPFLSGFLGELRRLRPGMMTLIALAITVAYGYSSAVVFGLPGKMFFWELATLIDIMLLGHWLEMKSVLGASRALEELASLMPSAAHRLRADGTTEEVPLEELRPGDRVLVKPGEKIPADGVVISGESAVNEAMLTGESRPVSKKPGDEVIGGAINGEGSLVVEIRRTGEESFLSQVISLVREAQESKSRTQDLANRAALWLTLIALSAGSLTLAVWLFLGQDLAFALERTVTVMVITCPHALGLAVPLVVAVSTGIAAKRGLLIRNRGAFERARLVNAVIFDKTGTLTRGEFGVTDVVALEESLSPDEILRLAAAVETNSEHPIARGIVASVKGEIPPVEEFRALAGKGALGRVEGREVMVVSPGYLREKGLEVADERVKRLLDQGKTVVFLLLEGKPAGAIALADVIREESREAITRLKARGIKCLMLTGDNRQVARWVAGELGLDDFLAEVLPQDKARKVKEIQTQGHIVAMTGDGVNDAPALAQADVGIAIGAGTDVAVETADVILVRSNPLDVVVILELSRATYRKMIQNLAWATGYNAFAIPLAAGVLYKYGLLLSPAIGALFMSLSTVIVAVNAKLLRI